ncbi:MAG: methyltransferase domain-containing protein [Actinobacteria bacterium]|nr:methyltransferase domain-containing protein [Actinomycetota bacterium]
MALGDREQREQDFWGHHIPNLEECIAQYHAGPDPNTLLMLDAIQAVEGSRVLDFACGAGTTSAWLAARGADVVGIDLSPHALAQAQKLFDRLGLEATFVSTTLEEAEELGVFDAIVGRYALHHTDVPSLAPLLARRLTPGGRAAFVESFATNPLLRLCRKRIVGRLGIPRMGTLDERPLGKSDVDALRAAFGSAHMTVAELRFLRIFDRQVLGYRFPRLGSALGAMDGALQRIPGSTPLSYYQVLVLEKTSL